MFKVKFFNRSGFSLIELSIVLLIAGLLIAGTAQLTANMQRQRGDQAQANQMRTVITALERFLSDQQGALAGQLTAGGAGLPLNALNISGTQAQTFFQQHYLPGTMNLNGYTIGIARLADIGGTSGAVNLRGLVLYQPANRLDDSRLARIAALIGAEGGMISSAGGANVTGTYGAWNVPWSSYGIPAASAEPGEIAAYTATVDSQINTNLLSRIATGNPEANRMHANLNMDGNLATDNGAVGFRLTASFPGLVCDSGVMGIYDTDGITYANPAYPLDANMHYSLAVGANASGDKVLLQCLPATDGSGQWEWQTMQQACGGANQQWRFITSGPYSGQGKQVDDNRALPPASLFRAGNPFSLMNTSSCDWVIAFNVQNTGCDSLNFNAGVEISVPSNAYLGAIQQDSPSSYHGNSNTNRNVVEFVPPGATALIYENGCDHNSYVYNIMVYK